MKILFLLITAFLPFHIIAEEEEEESPEPETIVDKEGQISDFQARLELAKALLTLAKPYNLKEALEHLQILLSEKPEDPRLLLPLGMVYLRQEKFQQAEKIFSKIIALNPVDPELLLQLAITQVELGYAVIARELFEKALKEDQSDIVLLAYANGMMLWGDFQRAESIFRDLIYRAEKAEGLYLKLALALRSQGRYDETEQIYRQLLESETNPRVLYELGQLKLILKDFCAVLEISQKLVSLEPDNISFLMLKAESLERLKEFDQALAIYAQLDNEVDALIKAGKIYATLGNCDCSKKSFEEAYRLNPNNPEIQYYLGVDSLQILESEQSPQILNKWGEIYTSEDLRIYAPQFFQAAIDANPDFFPAYMNLASSYSSQFEYDLPKEIYKNLLEIFPCSYRLMLEQARAFSSDKDYQESVCLYQEIIDIDPQNPVPIIEQARVEMWDFYGHEAMAVYSKLLFPTVNEQLFKAFSTMDCTDPYILERLEWHIVNGDIYEGYEELKLGAVPEVQRVLTDHFAAYRIQKAVYLESQAEWFLWTKRPLHALPYLMESMEFTPGNETAIFEFAQTNCALGLCDAAKMTYINLLDMDPLHTYAKMALEREEIREDPKIDLRYTHWRELGRGGLSSIMRHRYSAGVLYPVTCRFSLYTAYERWYEKPTFVHHNTFISNGCSIGFVNTCNAYLSFAGGLTQKNYKETCVGLKYLGNFKASLNFCDRLRTDIGYERQDVITNYFGLAQGIQADTYYVSLRSDINRRWNAYLGYQYWRYNDRNDMDFAPIAMTWQFTEYPTIFKVFAEGEYRNTAHMDVFVYNGPQLVNIIHPYWTPQHYLAGRFGFQWHHDYPSHDFCGAERRFYDVKFWLGSDTEHNDACGLVVQWHHDFLNRWSFEFNGFLERSEQWNAEGIWITLNYSI